MPTTDVPPITLSASVPRQLDALVVGLAEASDAEILIGLPEDVAKSLSKTTGLEPIALARRFGASAKPGRTALLAGPAGLRALAAPDGAPPAPPAP